MTRKHELRRRVPSAAADGNEADCIETIKNSMELVSTFSLTT